MPKRTSVRGARSDFAEAIAREVTGRVRSGQWREGEVLPSLRAFSAQYRVSHETVRRALQALEDQGLVRKIQGRGTVVGGIGGEGAPGRTATLPTLPPTRSLTVETAERHSIKGPFWDQAAALFAERSQGTAVRFAPAQPADPATHEPRADVVHEPTWCIEEYAGRGLLLDLRPWMTEASLYGPDRMIDPVPGRADAPCWGIPIAFDTRVVYVNLAEVGGRSLDGLKANWCFEELVAWAAQAFRRSRGDRPLMLPRPLVLLSLFGLDPVNPARLAENVDRLAGVLQDLREWHRVYPLYEQATFAADAAVPAYREFIGGRAPIVFHHTFSIPETAAHMRDPWAVWPMPARTGAPIERVSLLCGVSRRCACPETAAALIRFLAGAEGQALMAAGKTNVPMRRSAAESDAFAHPPPEGLRELVRTLGPTREWLMYGGRAFYHASAAIWDEEVVACVTGLRSAAEACDRVRARCAALAQAHGLGNGARGTAA